MSDPSNKILKLLKKDKRYKFDAYVFVFEALNYAHEVLRFGEDATPDVETDDEPAVRTQSKSSESAPIERHLSGQQLCEAIRLYALEQYGYMAKCVLNSWGVKSTADFGEIVFNLIEIKQMKKTKHDRREDFDNVFDFEKGLVHEFKIIAPPQTGGA
ncbi:MAG: hypothetical protein SGJ20_21385 [Planctomycetota bacterium]|nr:hypothetical protein [Planctomycetota bacterium]